MIPADWSYKSHPKDRFPPEPVFLHSFSTQSQTKDVSMTKKSPKIPKKIQERADKIGLILDELYPKPPIPLDHKDAFTLLIAVLLSAQTTDLRVNMVTPDLFELADNPYD